MSRTKEVEEAINRLVKAQNSIWEATLYSQEQQDEDIKTALNYIEELEKLPNKIRKKIEILEKLQNEFKKNEELRIKIIAYKELLESEN